jgi:hypothetical protein
MKANMQGWCASTSHGEFSLDIHDFEVANDYAAAVNLQWFLYQ